MNWPRFADIVTELSESLRAMAGYLQLLDIGAFRGKIPVMAAEINECRRKIWIWLKSMCKCACFNQVSKRNEADESIHA